MLKCVSFTTPFLLAVGPRPLAQIGFDQFDIEFHLNSPVTMTYSLAVLTIKAQNRNEQRAFIVSSNPQASAEATNVRRGHKPLSAALEVSALNECW